jgi:hypothetical protein
MPEHYKTFWDFFESYEVDVTNGTPQLACRCAVHPHVAADLRSRTDGDDGFVK